MKGTPVKSRFVDNSFLPTAIPTPRQIEYQSWEMGIFFHFGIRTFYEGRRDWDGKPMPADGFRPTALDCNDWIEDAKRAGMKYAVLVCKHHDGFANWPSKFSDYTVAQTPWQDGKGDVVREFAIHVHNGGMLITVYKGQNIGHKVICRFPLLAAKKVIVEITECDRPARLSNVELHNTCGKIYEKPSRPISSGETLSENG